MALMESLKLKKVIFNPTEIILLKKKSNIVINIDNIKWMEYAKPTFWNRFWAGLLPGGVYPGYLKIWLKEKIKNSKSYFLKIKYDEFLKLPEVYQKKIHLTVS